MFRKYEKTFRITTPNIKLDHKLNLSYKEQCELLVGTIQITEKVDGANVAIVRGENDKWTLQKRRGLAEQGVHAQYSFFWQWARYNLDKILKIPSGWIVYGELCRIKHHIFYDQLPSYFLVFDVWDTGKYHEDSPVVAKEFGFQHVPVLYHGHTLQTKDLESFINKSSLASQSLMEGIVIKNYKKHMRGKLVKLEFVKALDEDEHWMSKPWKKNLLREGRNVYD